MFYAVTALYKKEMSQLDFLILVFFLKQGNDFLL